MNTSQTQSQEPSRNHTGPQIKVNLSGRTVPPEAFSSPYNLEQTQKFFAAKVKSLRLSRHLTMRQLAIETDTDPSYITLIERGRIPSSTKVAKLARALGVLPSELFPAMGQSKPDADCMSLARKIQKLSSRNFAAVLALVESLQSKEREKPGSKNHV